jgi:hypothetical protein
MSARARKAVSEELGLGDNPLAADDVLVETFYAAPKKATAKKPATKKKTRGRRMPLKDGASFRLVTFSFYEDDVVRLDQLLAEARKQGKRKASRSQIVRLALRHVDVALLPDDV